jgi:hypothetical protein
MPSVRYEKSGAVGHVILCNPPHNLLNVEFYRLAADLTACIAPEPGDLRGMDRPAQCSHMVDIEVIVRLPDRGAQRLDHLHDQALCGPKGAGNRRSPT